MTNCTYKLKYTNGKKVVKVLMDQNRIGLHVYEYQNVKLKSKSNFWIDAVRVKQNFDTIVLGTL